jgi:hypothetical protein
MPRWSEPQGVENNERSSISAFQPSIWTLFLAGDVVAAAAAAEFHAVEHRS